MRIGVIGTGALGGVFAALLTLAGHEVHVVARGEHKDQIRANGIHLRGGFGESIVRVSVVDTLENCELVLVCTKAHDTAQALRENADSLSSCAVIMVQNGLDGTRIARSLLPTADVFGALCLIAANFTTPGVVTVTNPSVTYVGRGSGPADAGSRRWASILNSAVPTSALDDFDGAVWTKLVVNMVNAVPAITGLSVQEVARNRFLSSVVAASMREAARVGVRAGVSFSKLHGITERHVRALTHQTLWRARSWVRSMARGMGEIPNLASTLQSIRRKRLTEIEHLNGAIVRTADSLGIDAPINRALTAIVHDVEASGEHLDARQLGRELKRRGVRL